MPVKNKTSKELDILAVIRACKEAKIRHFKYKSLEILFETENPVTINEVPSIPEGSIPEKKLEPSRDDELFNLMLAAPDVFEDELSKDLETKNDEQ